MVRKRSTGFDCFLSAKQVGPQGKVIGVDMTPEMLARARGANTHPNVEFRLGELDNLPCGDGLVDCVISNCVVNLVGGSKLGLSSQTSTRVIPVINGPPGRLQPRVVLYASVLNSGSCDNKCGTQ